MREIKSLLALHSHSRRHLCRHCQEEGYPWPDRPLRRSLWCGDLATSQRLRLLHVAATSSRRFCTHHTAARRWSYLVRTTFGGLALGGGFQLLIQLIRQLTCPVDAVSGGLIRRLHTPTRAMWTATEGTMSSGCQMSRTSTPWARIVVVGCCHALCPPFSTPHCPPTTA